MQKKQNCGRLPEARFFRRRRTDVLKFLERREQHGRLRIYSRDGGKMGRVPAPGSETVYRGPHSGGAEIQRRLGDPHGRRQAGGPAPDQAQGGGQGGGRGDCAPASGPDSREEPYAADEYALCAWTVPGRRGGHGGGAAAGHRPGGVSLLQRAPGGGGRRGGALFFQSRSGDAAVRLPDLRLCQPVSGAH